MDILAALEQVPPVQEGKRTCLVQRWLNSINDTTPGKPQLVATFTTANTHDEHYRTLDQLTQLASRLGLETSGESIGRHRGKRCRCYM